MPLRGQVLSLTAGRAGRRGARKAQWLDVGPSRDGSEEQSADGEGGAHHVWEVSGALGQDKINLSRASGEINRNSTEIPTVHFQGFGPATARRPFPPVGA